MNIVRGHITTRYLKIIEKRIVVHKVSHAWHIKFLPGSCTRGKINLSEKGRSNHHLCSVGTDDHKYNVLHLVLHGHQTLQQRFRSLPTPPDTDLPAPGSPGSPPLKHRPSTSGDREPRVTGRLCHRHARKGRRTRRGISSRIRASSHHISRYGLGYFPIAKTLGRKTLVYGGNKTER